MKNPKYNSPPTEREIRVAAQWLRVARLMEQSIRSRRWLDPETTADPLARYAPLRFLLDDSYSNELDELGLKHPARDYRSQQRRKYAELLNNFERDAVKARRDWIAKMDAAQSWQLYARLHSQKWAIRTAVLRLRLALLMQFAPPAT